MVVTGCFSAIWTAGHRRQLDISDRYRPPRLQILEVSMKKIRPALALTLMLGCATAPIAQAAELFDFRFISPSMTIIGQLLGTVQADGNTVLVQSVQGAPLVNGSPFVQVPFVDSLIDVVTGGSAFAPRLSLNGQVMDFAACLDASCDDGFGFDAAGALGFGAVAVVVSGGAPIPAPYSPSFWTLSPVPEAGTWALMALGLGGIALRLRRQG